MIFGIGVWACMDSALFQNDGGTAAFHGVTHMDRWICMDWGCFLNDESFTLCQGVRLQRRIVLFFIILL